MRRAGNENTKMHENDRERKRQEEREEENGFIIPRLPILLGAS